MDDKVNSFGLREVVDGYMRGGLSQRALAQEVGISGATLSLWLKGTYKGDSEAIEAKVRKWVAGRQDRETTPLQEIPSWVDSPTGQRIYRALRFAQIARTICVIYGGAGVGKSCTAAEYSRNNPNVWIVEITGSRSTLSASLDETCEAVGIAKHGRPSRASKNLQLRLEGTAGLLVLDEAQWLNRFVLEEFRRIQELAGIGLAIMGNESIYTRMRGSHRAPEFAQFYSRIGQRLELNKPIPADVSAILAAWGLRGKEYETVGREIVADPANLRGLTYAIQRAFMEAGGKPPTPDQIRAAWKKLGGEV